MMYIEGQIEQTKAYIAYWHAMIVSGAYKQRDLARGCKPDIDPSGWVKLTDEEKLKNATNIMLSHCHTLSDLIEHLPISGNPRTPVALG